MTTTPEYFASLFQAGGGVVQLPQDVNDYNFGSKDTDHKYCPFQWDVSKLEKAKTLKPFTTGIHDQVSTSSCVGNGWAKTLEIMLKEQMDPMEISREFIYYNARARTGLPVTDVGSSCFLAVAEMTKQGAAKEPLWPFDISKINVRPSDAAYADGALRKVGKYERLGTNTHSFLTGETVSRDFVRDVKVAISCGMPVTVCTPLTNGFYYVKGPLSSHIGQYNPPFRITPATAGYIGAHCMCIVGYDDSLGGFIVENSWGPTWGDNGFILMSYASLSNNQFDSFVVREFNGVTYSIPDEYYVWDAKQRIVTRDFDGIPGQVYRLYQAAFNRRPDWDGLGYHIYYATNGLTLDQIADNFGKSPEYTRLYGNTTNRRFVELLYQLALYRQPDTAGWNYHVDLLDRGVLTRGQVMRNFAESPENKQNCLPYYNAEGIKFYPYTPSVGESLWNILKKAMT